MILQSFATRQANPGEWAVAAMGRAQIATWESPSCVQFHSLLPLNRRIARVFAQLTYLTRLCTAPSLVCLCQLILFLSAQILSDLHQL
jgi:hypothetical protein